MAIPGVKSLAEFSTDHTDRSLFPSSPAFAAVIGHCCSVALQKGFENTPGAGWPPREDHCNVLASCAGINECRDSHSS